MYIQSNLDIKYSLYRIFKYWSWYNRTWFLIYLGACLLFFNISYMEIFTYYRVTLHYMPWALIIMKNSIYHISAAYKGSINDYIVSNLSETCSPALFRLQRSTLLEYQRANINCTSAIISEWGVHSHCNTGSHEAISLTSFSARILFSFIIQEIPATRFSESQSFIFLK